MLRTLALLAALALPSAAAAECTLKVTGASTQEFPCKAELRQLDGTWILLLSGRASLPWDFSLSASFRVQPERRTYGEKDLKDMQAMARDKHADGANWSARYATEIPKWGPKKLPAPEGSARVSIAEVGREPEVHGSARVTLVPQLFNKGAAKANLELTFEY